MNLNGKSQNIQDDAKKILSGEKNFSTSHENFLIEREQKLQKKISKPSQKSAYRRNYSDFAYRPIFWSVLKKKV